MACKQKISKKEQYLDNMFNLLRKRDRIECSIKKTHFNPTELRLISEVLAAKKEGRRLISTQLATLLGVTRSAISQIVNNLEKAGVVQRVADDVDRKIAYIEVTDTMLETYRDDINVCADFIGNLVDDFGEARFNEMCDMFNEFMDLIVKHREECHKKKAAKKKAGK